MFGGFLTPPDNPGADFGALFWHGDGFSAACGHGTIALGVWAIESGRVVADPSGTTDVTIDVPSGRVVARVHANGEHITEVDFINVPSYALATDVEIATSRGKVIVDVGYAGSNYVHLRAADVGLSVTRDNINELVDIGRELKTLMSDTLRTQPSARSGRSGIYGTIIFDEIDEIDEDESGNLHQRNVTIFADGAFDRSPCGSGSASSADRSERRLPERLLPSTGSAFDQQPSPLADAPVEPVEEQVVHGDTDHPDHAKDGQELGYVALFLGEQLAQT